MQCAVVSVTGAGEGPLCADGALDQGVPQKLDHIHQVSTAIFCTVHTPHLSLPFSTQDQDLSSCSFSDSFSAILNQDQDLSSCSFSDSFSAILQLLL